MASKVRSRLSLGGWLPVAAFAELEGGVALTFDDGPSPETTPAVLELLRGADVKATFFFTAERARQYPELVSAVVRNGHSVYGHGDRHVRMDCLAHDEFLAALERAEQELRIHRPTPSPYLVRLPYGAGHGSARVHRLIRRWHPESIVAHWRYSTDDWLLANGCRSHAELQYRCETAVLAALSHPRFRGGAILLHEKPYDAEAPLSASVAPILLHSLLCGLDRARLPVSDRMKLPARSRLKSFVRTVAA